MDDGHDGLHGDAGSADLPLFPDGAGDTPVGTAAFGADDGAVSFTLSSEPLIPAGGGAHYLVVCDFASTALPGSDFQFQVNVPAGVVCQGANSLTPVVPLGSTVMGKTKTIACSGVGSLTMSLGANSPAPGTAGRDTFCFSRRGLR